MNYSRLAFLIFSLLFSALILSGCGGENAEFNNEKSEEWESVKLPVDSAIESKITALLGFGYPKLNNENAEEFLLEWGEENEIKNVILETKHGDIELELYTQTPIHSLNFLYNILAFRQLNWKDE